MLADALACVTIKQELLFDIIHCEKGAQRNAFRCDDIAQFLAFGALDLDIALFNQTFEMPVNRSNCHAKLGGQGSLGHIRIALDMLKQCQFAR